MSYQKELTPVYYNLAALKCLTFSVGENVLRFPMHWHDRIEIIYVREGRLYLDDGKEELLVQSDEMAIFLPRHPHKGYTKESKATYDVLMFDIRSFYNNTEICKKYLPAMFDGRVQCKKIIRDKEMVACCERIIKGADSNSLEIIAYIYQLLYLLMERAIEQNLDEISRDETVMEMIRYIEGHFEEEMSVSKLAQFFGYSKEHFCRKFKEATGLAPMKYLGIYRMEMAEKMLKHTNQSISEVAGKCGFYDANYFTRCFKAHFGMAPTKYIAKEEK